MKIYCVGGAVRDQFLNRPIKDRDWVVTGATPEEMITLGFKPVGKSFPVFLHPETHEEYALARTEKKVGTGHTGFECYAAPDVTLEEDLMRRDLTINAMALDHNQTLIDPYGGLDDLKAGILRHVSPAFRDDPLRVLRVARFAARFGFRVAEGTLELLKEMVAHRDLDYLSQERIWAEWQEGLCSDYPHEMLDILRQCGALKNVWNDLDTTWQNSGQLAMTSIPHIGTWLKQALAAQYITLPNDQDHEKRLLINITLCTLALYASPHSLNAQPLHQRCLTHAHRARWPKPVTTFQQHILQTLKGLDAQIIGPDTIVNLFEYLDGIRRPHQASQVFSIVGAIITRQFDLLNPWSAHLKIFIESFNQLKTITPNAWINQIPRSSIPHQLRTARLAAIEQLLKTCA